MFISTGDVNNIASQIAGNIAVESIGCRVNVFKTNTRRYGKFIAQIEYVFGEGRDVPIREPVIVGYEFFRLNKCEIGALSGCTLSLQAVIVTVIIAAADK